MDALTPAQLAARRRLLAARGALFNRRYINGQVRGHQAAVQLFESEAQQGRSPLLRHFAQTALPMLRAHLRRAEAIRRRVG
ncbi:MAG TPA: DUF4142 domain-containing protein [Stellaceae bacterium]|nr:DUF4142 domain-containing protein [Stellaceae bacterium]